MNFAVLVSGNQSGMYLGLMFVTIDGRGGVVLEMDGCGGMKEQIWNRGVSREYMYHVNYHAKRRRWR